MALDILDVEHKLRFDFLWLFITILHLTITN
jgi:hypothetical protein